MHLDGGDVLRARTIILACGVAWRRLAIEGFDRLAGKGISYGAARSEAPNTHGLDVHIVGAGNSAGQAAMFFSTHARSVTILCRGDCLEKSMSRYLIDQLATRPNIGTLFRTEVAAVARRGLARGDRRPQLARRARRRGSSRAACSSSSAPTRETGWLPPEIALDRRGYVLTGSDMRAAGRWALDRDPYLLETSVPGIFACGDVRFGPVKRVAAAVGEGSMAIAFVHQYLRDAGAVVAQPSVRATMRAWPSSSIAVPTSGSSSEGHPCWRVQKALDEQGIEYELVKGPLRPGKRDDLERLSGQRKYPVIEFEDGSVYRAESKDMAARIRSGKLLDQPSAG